VEICRNPEGLDVCEGKGAEAVEGAGEGDGGSGELGWGSDEAVEAVGLDLFVWGGGGA
jgi:hypothetical protein